MKFNINFSYSTYKPMQMQIQKRNGHMQPLDISKIVYRIDRLIKGTDDKGEVFCEKLSIDANSIALEVCQHVKDGIKSTELDEITAEICAYKLLDNPEYNELAKRLIISNNHKNNRDYISLKAITKLLNKHDRFSHDYLDLIERYGDQLDKELDFRNDYLYLDYFGFKTLEKNYLIRTELNGHSVMERPQHLWMRVALEIHRDDTENVVKTYNRLSNFYYVHATPTLFNSGHEYNQLSSCFLNGVSDSIESMYETVRRLAHISKNAGGIGCWLSDIRGNNAVINSSGGKGSGIIPYIRSLNDLSKHVDQGGKRKGSIACFPKDTEVYTVNEGPKKIQDIRIGDMVVTQQNRVKPVVQLHKNPLGNRKIYRLDVERNKGIYVTGNHKFWSCYAKMSKYGNVKRPAQWNSIEELKTMMDSEKPNKKTCYIAIPSGTNIEDTSDYKLNIMDYQHVILNEKVQELLQQQEKVIAVSKYVDRDGRTHSKPINKIWNITEDFANLIGIWLGDGHIRKAHTNGYVLGIGFTIHKDNKKEIDYIKSTCETIFGCNTTYHESKTSKAIHVTLNSHMVGSIFMELFGSRFNGKKLPNMIFSWPQRLVCSLIAGLITSDGNITKKSQNITIGLSNKNLSDQLYHLCRNNGIKVSFVEGKKIPSGQTCIAYTLSIPAIYDIIRQTHKMYNDDRVELCLNKALKYKENEIDVFLKIKNITETDRKDEYVYTLGVEDDHSYTVEGLLVENCYLEPFHPDIFEFLDLRKNTGNEELRTRDIFLALCITDLFMSRVKQAIMNKSQKNGQQVMWSLMCPKACPGLTDSYGEDFAKLYTQYEQEGRYVRQVDVLAVWDAILDSQMETSLPYMMYKDAVNRKSNQKNLGTIKSSNLCVAGDTLILTNEGQIAIADLVDKEVTIWNGVEWSDTVVKQTGRDQQLLEIEFSHGLGDKKLKCTPYHKFYVKDNGVECEVRASDLKVGSTLIDYKMNQDDIWIKDNKVESMRQLDQRADTYCFNEPKRHMGTFNGILAGNCIEIMEYSSHDEYACCNLSSICLPKFVDETKPYRYDLELLADVAGEMARNLNRIIDQGYYPIPQIKKSNLKHRPIGIGVQGLADVFFKLGYPYESPEAQELNRLITEAMYYGAMRESCRMSRERQTEMEKLNGLATQERQELAVLVGELDLAELNLVDFKRQGLKNPTQAEQRYQAKLEKEIETNHHTVKEMLDQVGFDGSRYNIYELQYWDQNSPINLWGAYSSFIGSPASKGSFQFDLWGEKPSHLFDWDTLKGEVMENGIRNSLLIAFMPTASTAQIMGNNECFEPITSNIYSRSVLSGNFVIVNKYLQRDLMRLELWNKQMKDEILRARGSIQNIEGIPSQLKEVYKTSWEISKKTYLKMARDRGIFIDQSQSLNLFIPEPTYNLLTTIHLYGWELGLKTGMYYLRRKTVANAQQFTVNPVSFQVKQTSNPTPSKPDSSEENNDDICISCSS